MKSVPRFAGKMARLYRSLEEADPLQGDELSEWHFRRLQRPSRDSFEELSR